jgi:hypothetical protein
LATKHYALIAQVGQAIGLPSDKNYNVKITVGGFEMLFEPFKQKESLKYKRYARSPSDDEMKKRKDECDHISGPYGQWHLKLPYVDVADFGKVIV